MRIDPKTGGDHLFRFRELLYMVALTQGEAGQQCRPGHRAARYLRQLGILVEEQSTACRRLEKAAARRAHGPGKGKYLFDVAYPARHQPPIVGDMGRRAQRREPDSAGLHRFAYDSAHSFDFFVGGGTFRRRFAHDIHAQRRMSEQDTDIDRYAGRVDSVEIFRERLEWSIRAEAFVQGVDAHAFHFFQRADDKVAMFGARRRYPETAIADDRRRNAVPGRDGQFTVPNDLCVVVGVDVDKTRRYDGARGIDRFRGIVRRIAECDDVAAGYADIAFVAVLSAAVDDRSADDLQIVRHVPSFCRSAYATCNP